VRRIKLTEHFKERWEERVGNWPTEEAVLHFIRNSVQVQRGEDVTRADGSPFRMLGIYWHPDLDMVVLCDEHKGAAVTVLTRAAWTRGAGSGDSVLEFCERASRVPAARVRALFGRRQVFA
jgi:hypothetical protein